MSFLLALVSDYFFESIPLGQHDLSILELGLKGVGLEWEFINLSLGLVVEVGGSYHLPLNQRRLYSNHRFIPLSYPDVFAGLSLGFPRRLF